MNQHCYEIKLLFHFIICSGDFFHADGNAESNGEWWHRQRWWLARQVTDEEAGNSKGVYKKVRKGHWVLECWKAERWRNKLGDWTGQWSWRWWNKRRCISVGRYPDADGGSVTASYRLLLRQFFSVILGTQCLAALMDGYGVMGPRRRYNSEEILLQEHSRNLCHYSRDLGHGTSAPNRLYFCCLVCDAPSWSRCVTLGYVLFSILLTALLSFNIPEFP